MKQFIAWGRLLRLSLAPSAAADIAAGLVVAHEGLRFRAGLWWLVPSSLAIYHGSMALNDWADRIADASLRPDRPITSGLISPASARNVAVVLLLVGIAVAGLAAPACSLWMSGIAALACIYNLWGRGPWIGPTLLALCRAGNLGAGAFAAVALGGSFGSSALGTTLADPELHVVRATWAAQHALVFYAAFVFCISRLGRLEDCPDEARIGRGPNLWLALAAVALVATPLSLLRFDEPASPWVALLVAATGAAPLAWRAWAIRTWTRALVLQSMGMCLRRLLVFSAMTALLMWPAPLAWGTALVILAGYPISFALRRVFPPS